MPLGCTSVRREDPTSPSSTGISPETSSGISEKLGGNGQPICPSEHNRSSHDLLRGNDVESEADTGIIPIDSISTVRSAILVLVVICSPNWVGGSLVKFYLVDLA
jgi:hypothetical protein